MHKEGKRLRYARGARGAGRRAARRRPTRQACTSCINARTDLFLRNDGDEADRVDRAIARLKLPPTRVPTACIPSAGTTRTRCARLTSELPCRSTRSRMPDQDDPASFGPLGVGRISFGPFFQRALSGRAEELLARWR